LYCGPGGRSGTAAGLQAAAADAGGIGRAGRKVGHSRLAAGGNGLGGLACSNCRVYRGKQVGHSHVAARSCSTCEGYREGGAASRA
jgi:hypothetical protein